MPPKFLDFARNLKILTSPKGKPPQVSWMGIRISSPYPPVKKPVGKKRIGHGPPQSRDRFGAHTNGYILYIIHYPGYIQEAMRLYKTDGRKTDEYHYTLTNIFFGFLGFLKCFW